MSSFLSLWLCFLFISPSFTDKTPAKCLAYEQNVELQGKLQRVTFPGPPNYQSIADGDQPEAQWVVDLSTHICLEKDKTNDAEKGLGTIQIIFPDSESNGERYQVLTGRKVEISGKLIHAKNTHHHTSVLMEVKSIKQIG